MKKLKSDASATETKLTSTAEKIAKLGELEWRLVKQECFNRRNNIIFFGINEREQESPEDTDKVLRKSLHKAMKMSSDELNEIKFERVHRIPTRLSEEKKQHPRPIIAKVSFFKDKELIKSHIKHVPKCKKELYPVLKKAKKDKKAAFFNVERLIIDKAVYLKSCLSEQHINYY